MIKYHSPSGRTQHLAVDVAWDIWRAIFVFSCSTSLHL